MARIFKRIDIPIFLAPDTLYIRATRKQTPFQISNFYENIFFSSYNLTQR